MSSGLQTECILACRLPPLLLLPRLCCSTTCKHTLLNPYIQQARELAADVASSGLDEAQGGLKLLRLPWLLVEADEDLKCNRDGEPMQAGDSNRSVRCRGSVCAQQDSPSWLQSCGLIGCTCSIKPLFNRLCSCVTASSFSAAPNDSVPQAEMYRYICCTPLLRPTPSGCCLKSSPVASTCTCLTGDCW